MPHAFSHVADVRHVHVEEGKRTASEAAWQSCLRLQIVKLPSTVICLEDGVFRRSYALRVVLWTQRVRGMLLFELLRTQSTSLPIKLRSHSILLKDAVHFGKSILKGQSGTLRIEHVATPGLLPKVGTDARFQMRAVRKG